MVRLEENKQATENKAIEILPLPAKVYIPLVQHLGKACLPEVKVGDTVVQGQRIAGINAQISALIHASVSGKVVAIQDWPHPVLGCSKAVVIESDGNVKPQGQETARLKEGISNLTPGQIRNIVFGAGIVGMGGASFPTHIKLNPPKPVDTLIINGAECEPFLTADQRLMVEKAEGIEKGIELIARCLGAKNIYIAIEDNKPEAIKRLSRQLASLPSCQVKILKSSYPQGGEKQLIKNILGKEVPCGKLPFDIGVVVQNVATVYAVYEAVCLGKPLYERVVTVTGDCISEPKNLLVPLGTPVKGLIDFCGPLKEEPAKLIIGGPMMGVAQYTEQVPVIKSTSGVVLFSKDKARLPSEEFCIRCGACVRDCPVRLEPCLISMAAEKEKWDLAKAHGCLDCIECGLCTYVCPQSRNIVQAVKNAKTKVSR